MSKDGKASDPSPVVTVNDVVLDLSNPPTKISGLRLNLGSGIDYKPDFLNVDLFDSHADANWDITQPFPLNENSIAQILCYETMEHLPQAGVLPFLRECHRVLKPKGTIHITVPDIVFTCQQIINKPQDEWPLSILFGNQEHPGQFHKSGFTPERLQVLIGQAGFRTYKCGFYNYGQAQNIYVEAMK